MQETLHAIQQYRVQRVIALTWEAEKIGLNLNVRIKFTSIIKIVTLYGERSTDLNQ